jgi:Tfp pilus assembly protein PilZ
MIYAVTGDLGPGGVFVHTGRPMKPGTPVRLVIELPDGGIAPAEGVVRWTKPGTPQGGPAAQAGVGMEFTRVSDELQAYLDDDCPFVLRAV